MGATFSGPLKRPRPGSYWIKSSLSYANGNCVEAASLPGGTIGVRNSRDSAGPVLRFTPAAWHAFLGGVRDGEFEALARSEASICLLVQAGPPAFGV